MEIKTKTARADNYSKGARKLSDIKYIVVHYTGNRGDTANNNAVYFARECTNQTSAHYFVDENETWQSVPDACVAWHCGTKGMFYHASCRNSNSLGVEICMLDKNGKVRTGSISRAAVLVRELMRIYNVPADHVIRHYDVTHKDCPAPMVSNPALWQAFKDMLKEQEDTEEMKYYEKITEIPSGEMRETVQLLIDRKVIAGNGSGLHLSEDMVRLLVYNRRMGLYK